jgi:hypothetical protein
MPTNRQHNYMIKSLIYQLKRQYGGRIDIYKFLGSTVDLCTGAAVTEKTLTEVTRAVVLPARAMRNFIQSISKISVDKAFVYGGTYDRRIRMFLVDRLDAPDLELSNDDWVVYDGKKYEIKHFDEFEFGSLWVIMGQAVVGDVPEQIFNILVDDRLGLEESSDQT